MAFRLVRTAAGGARIQLIPGKCRYLIGPHEHCAEPVRLAPGAIYCDHHKEYENAGCAAHDKLKCKDQECI